MTIKLTIIGLGQIGASIGLALQEHKDRIYRIGNDRERSVIKQAETMGAIDRGEFNLPSAVSEADVVLLAVPVDEVREVLDVIKQDLKEDAVVIDTTAVKMIAHEWFTEIIPQGRHYVAYMPVVKGDYLQETDFSINSAHADLFKDGLMALASYPGTPGEAVKLAASLAELLGATPFFADPEEVDGLLAAVHLLPKLTSVALLNATMGQPGWLEARKLVNHAYYQMTMPVTYLDETVEFGLAALNNRDNVVRVIDNLIYALSGIRNDIANQDAVTLKKKIKEAQKGRQMWLKKRMTSDWAHEHEINRPEVPSSGEFFGRLFGFGKRKKSTAKEEDED